jgi:hypothetical protein
MNGQSTSGSSPTTSSGSSTTCSHPSHRSTLPTEGGKAALDTLRRDQAQATIFDTFGRVLEGEENLADTIAAYNRWTAIHLKAEGIASARLDHLGHKNPDRARGSSAKGADVDVAWVLTRGGVNTIDLNHYGVSRLRWVPRRLYLQLVEGPPDRYRRTSWQLPEGTDECVELLDRLNVPVEYGRDKARQLLKEHDGKATNTVLAAAIRLRRDRQNLSDGQLGRVGGQQAPDRSTDRGDETLFEQGTDRYGQVRTGRRHTHGPVSVP